MAWFGRDRGAKDGLPPGFADRLERALREEIAETAVPDKALREASSYVRTGEPVRALTGWNSQGYYYGVGGADPAAAELYADFDQVDPDVWVRWGQVIQAMHGRATSRWSHPLTHGTALPPWVDLVLGHIARITTGRPVPVGMTHFGRVLDAAGSSLDALLDALFGDRPHAAYGGQPWRAVSRMPGYAEVVVAAHDRLRGKMTTGSVEQRLVCLEMLAPLPDASLAAYAAEIAVDSTATSARVREAALPLLLRVLPTALPALRERATEGKPDERLVALTLIWQHAVDDEQRHVARTIALADRSERIRALLDEWAAAAAPPEPIPGLQLPAPEPVSWAVDLDEATRANVRRLADDVARAVAARNEQNRRYLAEFQAQHGQQAGWRRPDIQVDRQLGDHLLGELEAPTPPTERHGDRELPYLANPLIQTLAANASTSSVALVKVLAYFGALTETREALSQFAVMALEAGHAAHGRPDLLTLAHLLDGCGLDGTAVVWRSITREWNGLAKGWPDDDVWPFLARNADHVVQHARPRDGDYWTDSSALYRLVGTMPVIPPVLVDHLYAVALGLGKTHRLLAQDALRQHPDRTARATAALRDGKAEVRATAATWLARIADPTTIEPLEAAVAKEKQDVAKGAMLDALQALGRPVETYLDRYRLQADADKALAKGLPRDLEWLSWGRLPAVHWSDSGDVVPVSVVQWLVAQAVRAKSPEPNAILRKYCAMLVEPDRHALGRTLLESWIAEDTRPIDPAEAQRQAQSQAASMHSSMQQWPQGYVNDPLRGKSIPEIAAALLPAIARQPAGSAASSKGLLAVVAACGGREVVAPTERYLKEWYGQRPAQGKALIGMLAWVDHPSATQLLLSIGSRFRTKSFQTEATRHVEALAEREGWTVAELADRTVPTAGFDAQGQLELSYGDRAFVAQLLPDLTIELHTPHGAAIKSLPAPRQTDDPDLAKAAKASLSAAKKDLKTIAQLQERRLYEALCTERTWPAADWRRFLADHPVMRLLVRRLVWRATTADDRELSFRLLDDGTLTDVADDAVTLPDDAVVRIAHDTNVSAGEGDAWLRHLEDYEVTPLFQQFGKGLHELPSELRARNVLEDFKGHTLEAFALRNRALRLGWTRGPAEDGGWFMTYLKRFPTLGLVATLEFTGNPLPEENRLVGLVSLGFGRESPQPSAYAAPVPLGEVPAVLLSETWHDVRLIAAEGNGFDPEWERKTQYS